MTSPVITRTLGGLAMLALCGSASAHVTLETREATVNSSYKAVLRVPHGCEGSPMVKLRVLVPEGVIAVKPMPKPGWALQTITGKYARPYTNHGTQLSEGVKEVVWTGKLVDEHYDEFVFRAQLTAELPAGEMLYFPTVQECEKGVERWIEIPAAGKSADEYKFPAPGLRLLPAKATH